MNPHRHHLLRPLLLTVFGLAGVLALGFVGGTVGRNPDVQAAAPNNTPTQPSVTFVSVTDIGSQSARIRFNTDIPSWARIHYGTSQAYTVWYPSDASWMTSTIDGDYDVTLQGLSPATTYHFVIETKAPNGSTTTTTGDRTFTTSTQAGGGSGLTLSNISVKCTGGNCEVSYLTSLAANVQLHWDTQPIADFSQVTLGSTGEAAGFYSDQTRSLAINNLSLGSVQYHYMLQATGQNNGLATSADLTFTTGQGSEDRTFSTGACTDKNGNQVPIGSCSSDGGLCENGGNLRYACDTACNYSCPGGQTCRAGGQCVADPSLDPPSPTKCNPSGCYNPNGSLINPVPVSQTCYASWPRCTANTILKVRKDRGCSLWLTCNTSVEAQTSPTSPAENLCLSLAACNSLGPNGQCNHYLPPGQCSNDPLRFCTTSSDCEAGGTCNVYDSTNPTQSLKDVTYSTPAQISKLANLSGNVIAGLSWDTVNNIPSLQADLPWQLMRQVGGSASLENGDLESRPPFTDGWTTVPVDVTPPEAMHVVLENKDSSINHVLEVSPVLSVDSRCANNLQTRCINSNDCNGDICGTQDVPFSGVATNTFQADANELYYAQVRVRSVDNAVGKVRVQLGFNDYTSFSVVNSDGTTTNTYADVTLTGAWQRVTLGPLKGLSGATRLAVVLAPDQLTSFKFQVDDAQVSPILQVNTTPEYVTPSCRLYPKDDSPACDYVDTNGIAYKGWHGYCLEHDSVTGTCLSWWPVDIIKGESSIFGTESSAGYTDRNPLYLCAESNGNAAPRNDYNSEAYTMFVNDKFVKQNGCDFNATSASTSRTFFLCNNSDISKPSSIGDTGDQITTYNLSTDEQNLYMSEIDRVNFQWAQTCENCQDWPESTFTVGADGTLQTDSYIVASGSGTHTQKHEQTDSDLDPRFKGACSTPKCIVWKDEPDGGYVAQYGNAVGFYLIFNQNGKLEKLGLWGNDESGSRTEAAIYRVSYHLKETCNTLVKVVDAGGANQVYASRLNSQTNTVDTLNYKKSTDLSPYGGALTPGYAPDSPGQWPLLSSELPNTTDPTGSTQARSGTPYACVGDCGKMVCSVDSNNDCSTPQKVQNCQEKDINNDGQPDGQCVGVKTTTSTEPASNRGAQTIDGGNTPTNTSGAYFAQERIRRLFVRSYGVYRWQNGRYTSIAGSWLPPASLCTTVDPTTGRIIRDPFPNDYCAIKPAVVDDPNNDKDGPSFLNGGAKTTTIDGGSGSIGIKFNTTADADQVPLQKISIDWGDSIDAIPFPFAPRSDPNNPHIYGHVYVANTGTPGCAPDQSGRLVCTFHIKILVQDNWGWCNDTDGSCSSNTANWYDTGLTVRVIQ